VIMTLSSSTTSTMVMVIMLLTRVTTMITTIMVTILTHARECVSAQACGVRAAGAAEPQHARLAGQDRHLPLPQARARQPREVPGQPTALVSSSCPSSMLSVPSHRIISFTSYNNTNITSTEIMTTTRR
jgi:hypothetical protein